ncbi:hypothetical protein Dsin_017234 [Dipteronia sinensis]|uniref:CSC1/OSCA1-like N-terminal transmembrane domain-containing protein n=1 Tax=Dipteronia sinensis TaxID=43782 RepID=A0AAE0E7P8_9ROSI|nr:hypothetical protein Dsin_017234 [Dipteronia sinensis]
MGRKQPSNVIVYAPRLVGKSKSQGRGDFHLERLLPSPGWVKRAWEVSEEELLSTSGLDAVVFMRIFIISGWKELVDEWVNATKESGYFQEKGIPLNGTMFGVQQSISKKLPAQLDNDSCGVYICRYADMLMRHKCFWGWGTKNVFGFNEIV